MSKNKQKFRMPKYCREHAYTKKNYSLFKLNSNSLRRPVFYLVTLFWASLTSLTYVTQLTASANDSRHISEWANWQSTGKQQIDRVACLPCAYAITYTEYHYLGGAIRILDWGNCSTRSWLPDTEVDYQEVDEAKTSRLLTCMRQQSLIFYLFSYREPHKLYMGFRPSKPGCMFDKWMNEQRNKWKADLRE